MTTKPNERKKSKDSTRTFVLRYRLTKDIPDVDHPGEILARAGEPILLALEGDENGIMAETANGRVSFYVENDEIEEE